MNKDKIKQLREIVEESLSPEALLEITQMDTGELLDMIDNDTLLAYLPELKEYIPSLDLWDIDPEDYSESEDADV